MARKRKCSPPSPSKDSSGTEDEGPQLDRHGKPIQRNAANARERQRMRVLSKAFGRLKTTLPWVPADTKLSKLDTLRLASCYIAHLRQILAEDKVTGEETGGTMHPLNLTWPFSFNSRIPSSSERRSSPSSTVKSESPSPPVPLTDNIHTDVHPTGTLS